MGLVIYDNGDYAKYGRFLNGELRVDGWESEWGISFRAYMKDKEARKADRPKAIHVAVPVNKKRTGCRLKGQTNSEYMKKRRAWAKTNNMCADCYHVKAREGKTTCQPCQDKRTAREMKRYNARKAA